MPGFDGTGPMGEGPLTGGGRGGCLSPVDPGVVGGRGVLPATPRFPWVGSLYYGLRSGLRGLGRGVRGTRGVGRGRGRGRW